MVGAQEIKKGIGALCHTSQIYHILSFREPEEHK